MSFADILQNPNLFQQMAARRGPAFSSSPLMQGMVNMPDPNAVSAAEQAAANGQIGPARPEIPAGMSGILGTAPKIPTPDQAMRDAGQGAQLPGDNSMQPVQNYSVNVGPNATPGNVEQNKGLWSQFLDGLQAKMQDPSFMQRLGALGAGMAQPTKFAGSGWQNLTNGAVALQKFDTQQRQQDTQNDLAQQKVDQTGNLSSAQADSIRQKMDVSKATMPFQIADAYTTVLKNQADLGTATANAQIAAIKERAQELFGIPTADAMLQEALAKAGLTYSQGKLVDAQAATEGHRPALVDAQASDAGANAYATAAKGGGQVLQNNIVSTLTPTEGKNYVGAVPKTMAGGQQQLATIFEKNFRTQHGIPAQGTPQQEQQVAGAVNQFLTQSKQADDMTVAARLMAAGGFDNFQDALKAVQQTRQMQSAAGEETGGTGSHIPTGVTSAFANKPDNTAMYDASTNTTYYKQGGQILSKQGKWIK